MLIAAVIIINLALVFYTVGVWGERLQRRLLWWHVAFFGLGFASDLTGTILMTRIAASNPSTNTAASFSQNLMAWTGTLAIALMAALFVWSTAVVIRGRAPELARFHRYSIIVWVIWLVPYFAGATAAMAGAGSA